MIRIYSVVEGHTEIAFIKNMLIDHFAQLGVYLYPALVGKPGHKGGVISYQRAKRDIIRYLRQDQSSYCTTMFDYYRLPNDFPGMPIQGNLKSFQKAEMIERAFKEDIVKTAGLSLITERFIPYIQIHEFEALLFSNPKSLANGMNRNDLVTEFEAICGTFESPEDIDDHPNTAPSKRIINLYKNYKKSTDGILAAIEIGLPSIRQKCKHFDLWLKQLESLKRGRD